MSANKGKRASKNSLTTRGRLYFAEFRFAAHLRNNSPMLAAMGASSWKSLPTLDTASLTARTD